MSHTADRELTLTRVFDAPCPLVYQAFTDPQHIVHWWGPNGFSNTIQAMDVRPGGVWRFMMHSAEGVDWPNKISYQEVVPNERLVYDHGSTDDQPAQFHVTITFAPQGQQTKVTMTTLFPTAAELEAVKKWGAVEGGQQTFARLAAYLADDLPFIITRVFNAPRALLFQVWTEPAHQEHWSAPPGGKLVVHQYDLRPGGTLHYATHLPDGTVMWGIWKIREVEPPARLVYVNAFSDASGGLTRPPMAPTWPLEILSTITFTDLGEKTAVSIAWLPINASAAERRTFQQGRASMQGGWSGCLDGIAAYLAKK